MPRGPNCNNDQRTLQALHEAQALQEAMATAWFETHNAANTRAAYRTDLETFGRWCAANGAVPIRADTTTLLAFHAAREAAGDSPSTLRRRWSALSSFYEFARTHDAALTNPTVGAARPPRPSGDPSSTAQLSLQAVAECRSAAASIDPRLDALVSLLVSDGLKIGEALALDIDNLTGRPPKTTIVIRRRGISVRIMLEPESARAVLRCAGQRRSGPLFTSNRAAATDEPRRLTRFGADHLIRQLTNDGENRVTANALRRFHIIATQAAGADLDGIRDRAGLADVRSVLRYLP